MPRCGVLGDPIEHSLSPALHRAGYAATGLVDWTYDAHRVPAGTLAAFLDGLDDTWRGLSLTMPLKRELLPLADEVTETARRAGGANTLLLHADRRIADNTDVPGLQAALRERHSGEIGSAVLVGGGATGASALLALADLGCRSFRLCVRNAGSDAVRETLDAAYRHPADLQVSTLALIPDPGPADILVSSVPVSAQTPELVAGWAAYPVVFEVVYDPWPTPLAAAVQRRGGTLVSGLDLLVHQAALQFTLFTGEPAPLPQMRAAGEQTLAARGA